MTAPGTPGEKVGAPLAHWRWPWRADHAAAIRFRSVLSSPAPVLPDDLTVSVLVAAWNEAATVEEHMSSVLSCDYPRLEYILCAGGPDGTYERARRHHRPGALVIEQTLGEGKQRALHRAYAHATGDVIYLCDADCLIDSRAMRHLLAPLLLEGEAAATGASMPFRAQLESSAYVRLQHAVQLFGDAHTPKYASALLGRNAAVRREALDRCGAFSADVKTGTDYHLGKSLLREGHRIRYVHPSRVTTRYAEEWRSFTRQQRRWLRNVVLHGARKAAWDEVASSLLTSAVGASMLTAPPGAAMLAGTRHPRLAGLVAATWSFAYGASVAAKLRYLDFARLADGVPPVSVAAVARYCLLDFAAWASPLMDYPSAAGRSRW
jgi:cellulose synthase/poly-beta-1,6-N-acetylglucosamine synthase-like glycosyltransferase